MALARTTTPTYSQESIDPFPISEVAPGVYVHFGANELMNAQNAGAIANVGFVVGGDAVAVIDTGGSVREGRALREAVQRFTDKDNQVCHKHPRSSGSCLRQCGIRSACYFCRSPQLAKSTRDKWAFLHQGVSARDEIGT